MNKKYIMPVIITLFTTALIVSIFNAIHYKKLYNELKSKEVKVEKKKSVKLKIEDKKSKTTETLKNRVKELEYQLQLKIVQPIQDPLPTTMNYSTSKKQTIEELKESDPERYNRIMSYYTKINATISDAVQDKLLYFNDIDTSEMSKKEKKDHQRLLEKLAKLDEFSQNNMDKTGPELRDIVKKQQNKLRNLYKDMRNQRYYLMFEAGRNAGLSPQEAKKLQNYMKDIEQKTSYRSFYHKSK